MLFQVALTLGGMGVFQWFLFPTLWTEHPIFVVSFFSIVTCVASIAVYCAVVTFQAHSTFVCRLDDEQFSRVSPVNWSGESFCLPRARFYVNRTSPTAPHGQIPLADRRDRVFPKVRPA